MEAAVAERDWLASVVGGRVHEFYAEIGVEIASNDSDEVMVCCFANPSAHKHDDRNKSCSVNVLTGLWCCHACGQKGNPYEAARARGYVERHAAQLAKRFGLFLEREKQERPRMVTVPRWQKWVDGLWAQPKLIRRLSELKGWTPYAIRRCALGWDGERIVFVVRSYVRSKYKIVGVVRYLPGGDPKMISWPGSERSLFPAPEFMVKDRPLFVVEGEPAAVSVRSADHQAIAVPGAGRWRSEWAQRLSRFQNVIVLPDCDEAGRMLARRVSMTVPRARTVDLEPGRDDGYDVGDVVAEASREGGVWQAQRILDGLAA